MRNILNFWLSFIYCIKNSEKIQDRGNCPEIKEMWPTRNVDPQCERVVNRMANFHRFDKFSVITHEVNQRYPGANVSKRCVK